MAEEKDDSGAASAGQPSAPPTMALLYNEIVQERKALVKIRRVSTFTLILIVVIYMTAIFTRIAGINGAVLGDEILEKMGHLMPEMNEAVNEVFRGAWPEAAQEIRARKQKRMPEIEHVARVQSRLLIKSLEEKLLQKFETELERQVVERRALIFKEFPELKNSAERDKLLLHIKDMMKGVIQRVLAKDIHAGKNAIDSISNTFLRKSLRDRIEALKKDPNLRSKTLGYLAAVISRPAREGIPEAYDVGIKEALGE